MTALLPVVESAFDSLLSVTAVTDTFAVYTGKGNEDKAAPCVIVEAESGEEAIPDTGNFTVSVKVTIKYKPGMASALAASNTATGAVHEIIFDQALAANLTTAATNFTCFGITNRQFSAGVDGDCWVETAELALMCCASDVG